MKTAQVAAIVRIDAQVLRASAQMACSEINDVATGELEANQRLVRERQNYSDEERRGREALMRAQ